MCAFVVGTGKDRSSFVGLDHCSVLVGGGPGGLDDVVWFHLFGQTHHVNYPTTTKLPDTPATRCKQTRLLSFPPPLPQMYPHSMPFSDPLLQ